MSEGRRQRWLAAGPNPRAVFVCEPDQQSPDLCSFKMFTGVASYDTGAIRLRLRFFAGHGSLYFNLQYGPATGRSLLL